MSTDRLTEDLIAISRAAPTISPGVAHAAASMNPDYGVAAQGLTYATQLRSRMQALSIPHQMTAWSGLQDADRRLLRAAGYAPPQERPEHRAWWQRTLGTIGDIGQKAGAALIGAATGVVGGAPFGAAVGSAFPGPGTAIGGVLGGLAGGLIGAVRGEQREEEHGVLGGGFGWALEDIHHAYRAGKILETESFERGQSRWAPWKWSWSEWGRAYREADDEIPDFTQPIERTLAESGIDFPAQDRDILRDAVGGMSEFDLYGKHGSARVNLAVTHPEWDRAGKAIAATQLSPARVIAYGLGIRPGTRIKPFGVGPEWDVFDFYSGLGDAILDFLGDPANVGFGIGRGTGAIAALKSFRIAKRGVADAADVRRVFGQGRIQRAGQRIADLMAASQDAGLGAAKVTDEFPRLASPEFMAALAEAAPRTLADVQRFFEENFALTATIGGRAARYYDGIPILPELSRLGGVKRAIKDGILDAIERVEFSGPGLRRPLVGPLGTAFRRAAYLVPGKKHLALSNAAVGDLRQLGLFALPRARVRELENLWLVANEEGKRRIALGLLSEVRDQAAADGNPYVREVFDNVLGAERKRAYGLGEDALDNSKMSFPSGDASTALFSHQLSNRVVMPNFREIVKARRQAAIWRQIPGVKHVDPDVVDRIMQRVWSPLVLLRLGMPIRNAGEEVALAALRNGFVATLREGVARGAVREEYLVLGLGGYGPSERTIIQGLADSWTRASITARKAIAGPRALQAAELAYREFGTGMLPPGVSALEDRAGQMDTLETITRMVQGKHGSRKRIRYRPTGGYKLVPPTDEIGLQAWHTELSRHMGSPEFRAVVELDDPIAQKEAVLDWLRSPEGVKVQARNPRSTMLPDGSAVGVGKIAPVTLDEALEDWAGRIIEASRSLTHNAQGQPIARVIDGLRKGAVPSLGTLARIPLEGRPLLAIGEEMVPMSGSWWETVVEHGFRGIGRAIDSIGRRRIFGVELGRALEELEPYYMGLKTKGIKDWRRLHEQKALELARKRTIGGIDRTDVKSQFAMMNRNLFPFWHAKQQFLTRWANAIVQNPGVVRRAQLGMAGVMHSGAVHIDENGDPYFYYPGVGWTHGVIKRIAKLVGADLEMPIPVAMTSKLKYLSVANLDSPRTTFLPDVGPIGVLGIGLLKARWPEFQAVSDVVQQEVFADRPLWLQLLPSTIARLVGPVLGDEQDTQIASAMVQAAQSLEASGHGLAEDATKEEQDEYNERLRQWARTLLGVRAVFGMLAPSSPTVSFEGSLQPELLKLLGAMSYEEAITEFMRRHPDATAWTVFGTEAPTGSARFAPTAVAGQFIAEHADLLKTYPASALSWFVPDAPGEFNGRAWRLELANDFRQRRSAREMWRAIKVRDASEMYYSSRRAFDAAYASAAGTDRAVLQASWGEWSERYFDAHPIFAEHYNDWPNRRRLREEALKGVEKLLADPRRPDVASVPTLRMMVESFRTYEASVARYPGRDRYVTLARKGLTASFRAWGQALTDPVARNLWDSLIEGTLPEEE